MPRINNFYFNEPAFRALPEAEQLWIACRENEFHIAAELLKQGADPNHCGGVWGKYSIHCAAENKNSTIINFLLVKGADPKVMMVSSQYSDAVLAHLVPFCGHIEKWDQRIAYLRPSGCFTRRQRYCCKGARTGEQKKLATNNTT